MPTTTDLREYLRFRAWDLHQSGWRQTDIATALGVTEGAVSQWIKRARQEGCTGLHKRSSPGRPAYLSPQQKAQIPVLLQRGAEAYGFRGDVWDRKRIREVIKQELGVTYHVSHITRLLREVGFSRQKPVPRASQRDEEAIEQWLQERWPMLKKSVNKNQELSSS